MSKVWIVPSARRTKPYEPKSPSHSPATSPLTLIAETLVYGQSCRSKVTYEAAWDAVPMHDITDNVPQSASNGAAPILPSILNYIRPPPALAADISIEALSSVPTRAAG